MLARRIRYRLMTCLNSSDSDLQICGGPSGHFTSIQVSGSTVTQIRGYTETVTGGHNRDRSGGFGAYDGIELVDLFQHL